MKPPECCGASFCDPAHPLGRIIEQLVAPDQKLDFIAKLGIVSEEADESAFWIELLEEAGKLGRMQSKALLIEANELVAIAVSSINTARKNT